MQSFLYDFAVDGGAVGNITTGSGCINTGIQIPFNAVIYQVTVVGITALTSAGGALRMTVGVLGTPFTAAQTVANWVGNQLGTLAGSIAVSGNVTGGNPVLLAFTVEACTGGSFRCFIKYFSPPTWIK